MSTRETLTPSRRFSRIINRLDQLLAQIEDIRTLGQINAGDIPPEPQRGELETRLGLACRLLTYLETETASALKRGNPVLTGVSEDVRRRYDYVFRNKEQIREADRLVFIESLDLDFALRDIDSDVTDAESQDVEYAVGTGAGDEDATETWRPDIQRTRPYTPIRNVFQTWLEDLDDLVRNGDVDLTPEEYDGIQWAVHAHWFAPDAWYEASRDSRLLVLSRDDENLPTWVNHRVKDLYRAYITGNYLAALTLARATLESALDHRADSLLRHLKPIEFDELRSPRRGGLGNWLNEYERAGIDLPYSDIQEVVQKLGNEALHGGRKDEKIGPIRTQETALRSITLTVRAIELLYRQ